MMRSIAQVFRFVRKIAGRNDRRPKTADRGQASRVILWTIAGGQCRVLEVA